jgi:hypothetical protein
VVLTLDTLEYAMRGGRVKRTSSYCFTAQCKASHRVADRMPKWQTGCDPSAGVAISPTSSGNGWADAWLISQCCARRLVAADLLARVKQAFNCSETIITDLSIGVAANLGPGTVGLVAYPIEEVGSERMGYGAKRNRPTTPAGWNGKFLIGCLCSGCAFQ